MYAHIKAYLLGGSLVALSLLSGCGILGGFCGAAPQSQSEVSLYVTDSTTGTPVRSPTFDRQGAPLTSSCQQPQSADPGLCESQLLFVDPGQWKITVSAPGYTAQTVSVDTEASDSVHLAVQLHAVK